MFQTFGFSGSRSLSGASYKKCGQLASFFSGFGAVLVGCASGADAAVRAAVPSAQVFKVSCRSRGAYAARSVKFVKALFLSQSPVLVSFPGSGCPSGLAPSAFPSRCFAGFGSGSWASLAFAVGLGIPIRVFLPSGVQPPSSWGKWSFNQSGVFAGSWSLSVPVQGSLF